MNGHDKQIYLRSLKYRITADIKHFGGVLPDDFVIIWSGYLAAILETSIISFSEYQNLTALLPEISNNPVGLLFEGRTDEHDA